MIKIVKKTGIEIGDKIFIPCEYDNVYPAIVDGAESKEIFITEKDNKKGIIKILHNEKGPTSYRPLKCQYSFIDNFVNGTAIISMSDERSGTHFGIINLEFEHVLPLHYENVSRISDRIFTVKRNGKYGVYDLNKSEIIVPCNFDKISYTSPSEKEYGQVSSIILEL